MVRQFTAHSKDNYYLILEVLLGFLVLPILLFLLTDTTGHDLFALCTKSSLSPLSEAIDFHGLSHSGSSPVPIDLDIGWGNGLVRAAPGKKAPDSHCSYSKVSHFPWKKILLNVSLKFSQLQKPWIVINYFAQFICRFWGKRSFKHSTSLPLETPES